jgi:hypothetical protein
MSTSSTNIGNLELPDYQIIQLPNLRLLDRQDTDDATASAMILESDSPGNLREDGVVFATPRVDTGVETASALSHDDRAPGNHVAIVGFHAEPL